MSRIQLINTTTMQNTLQHIINALYSEETIHFNSENFLEFFSKKLEDYVIEPTVKHHQVNQLVEHLEKYIDEPTKITVNASVSAPVIYDCLFCLFLLLKLSVLSAASKNVSKHLSYYLKIYKKHLKEPLLFYWYFKYIYHASQKSYHAVFSSLHTYNNLIETNTDNLYLQILNNYKSLFDIQFKWNKSNRKPDDVDVTILTEQVSHKTFEFILTFDIEIDNYISITKILQGLFSEKINSKILFHINLKYSKVAVHPTFIETLPCPNMLLTQKRSSDQTPSSLLGFLLNKYKKPVIQLNTSCWCDGEILLEHFASLQNSTTDIAHYTNGENCEYTPHRVKEKLLSFYNYTNGTSTYINLLALFEKRFTSSNLNFMNILTRYATDECKRFNLHIMEHSDVNDIINLQKLDPVDENIITLTKNEQLTQSHEVQAGQYRMNIEFLFPLKTKIKLMVQIKNPNVESSVLANSLGVKYNEKLKAAYLNFNNKKISQTITVPDTIKNLDFILTNKNKADDKIFVKKFELCKESSPRLTEL